MKLKILLSSMLFIAVVVTQPLYAQDNFGQEIVVGTKSKDVYMGTGEQMVVAGATFVFTGVLLELATLISAVTLNETDVPTNITNSSSLGVYNSLHIVSASLIAAGSMPLFASIGYTDDSAFSKSRWKKTQIIVGATLLSVGSVLGITGGGLYASDLKDTSDVVEITSLVTMGVGFPFATAGITSLITAFTAK